MESFLPVFLLLIFLYLLPLNVFFINSIESIFKNQFEHLSLLVETYIFDEFTDVFRYKFITL